jgi:hypothetical protein
LRPFVLWLLKKKSILDTADDNDADNDTSSVLCETQDSLPLSVEDDTPFLPPSFLLFFPFLRVFETEVKSP